MSAQAPLRLVRNRPDLGECPSCARPASGSFELSRLVHEDEELVATPVVAVINLCDDCLRLLVGFIELTGRGWVEPSGASEIA